MLHTKDSKLVTDMIDYMFDNVVRLIFPQMGPSKICDRVCAASSQCRRRRRGGGKRGGREEMGRRTYK